MQISDYRIEQVSPDAEDVRNLIEALDVYQEALYPSESNHLDDLDTLKQKNVVMIGVRENQDLAGIGAVKFMEGYAEIKRMYIPKAHRRKGIAGKILLALEHLALSRNIVLVRLETGIHQTAAITLYRTAGFVEIEPFGSYAEDPLSVFMEKKLVPIEKALVLSSYSDEYRNQVIDLWKICGLTVPWNDPQKDIQRKLDNSPDLFYLALMDDHVIGSCMAGYDGHRGWFYYLGVSPEFRKKGIAKLLIQHGEDLLRELGCPKINLMVRKTNTNVIQFYKSAGYGDDPVLVLSKRLEADT
jgi:ribosomal protein S18 acetylase RimI-like enzyme